MIPTPSLSSFSLDLEVVLAVLREVLSIDPGEALFEKKYCDIGGETLAEHDGCERPAIRVTDDGGGGVVRGPREHRNGLSLEPAFGEVVGLPSDGVVGRRRAGFR